MKTVFLDTNVVDNPSAGKHLLGRYRQLVELSALAQIAVARITLEEIFQHKREAFEKEKAMLAKSELLKNKYPDFDPKAEKYPYTLEDLINEQQKGLSFAVADFSNTNAFIHRFRELAVKKQPPFEAETDKGFKDSMIAETIIEYKEAHPEEEVYFLVEDKRLAKFFDKNVEYKVTTFYNFSALIEFLKTEAKKTKSSNIASNIIYNYDFKQRELAESLETIRDWATKVQTDLTVAGTVISQPLVDLSSRLHSTIKNATDLVCPDYNKTTNTVNLFAEQMKKVAEQMKDIYGSPLHPYDI